jgi:Zn-dependent protease
VDEVLSKIFVYLVIVFAAVFHEYGHGFMAYELGDDTAKRHGRLTLNPLAHLDALGTVFIPLFLLFTSGTFIGWAKPVPYNPYFLRDKKYGSLKVALAGPLVNLVIALFLGLILRFSIGYSQSSPDMILEPMTELLSFVVYVNIFLALFNLLPVPPLDGSKIFIDLFPRQSAKIWRWFEGTGFFGIFLALFIAMFFLPTAAHYVFYFITGRTF